MSSIVKHTNKKTGITYVYESESYWDKEKQQPRNKRKLIGKLDDNGQVVPTGKRGRRKKEAEGTIENDGLAQELLDCRRELDEANKKILEQELLIVKLQKEKRTIQAGLIKILNDISG